MQKTCKDAYSIFTEHSSISNKCSKKVMYLNTILETLAKKTTIGPIAILPAVLYAEKSLLNEKLTDYQKGLLVNTLTTIKIQWGSHTRGEINLLLKRLVNAIMD